MKFQPWSQMTSFLSRFFFFELPTSTYYLVPLAIQLIVAWQSHGFFHPDEQYYTLHFALYKMGQLNTNSLSWEFAKEIRPWSLPYLYYLLFSFFKFIGVTNPFTLMGLIRILTALFSWYTLRKFAYALKNQFQHQKYFRCFLFLLLSFWGTLFMGPRTSSDNICSSLFLLGLIPFLNYGLLNKNSLTQKMPSLSLFASGLLMGASFIVRFQVGFLIFFFTLWAFFFKKVSLKSLSFIFLPAIFFMIGLGFLLDSAGYEHWTFTPYNYFYFNIIKKVLSSFGVSPWWHYFKMAVLDLIPLWGIPLLLSSLYFIYKFPKHLFSILLVTFFFIHSCFGHKELRFIYPLLPLSLFTFIIVLQMNFPEMIFKKLFKFLLLVNFGAILFIIIRPAYSPMLFYKNLWSMEASQENVTTTIYMLPGKNETFPKLDLKFYLKPTIHFVKTQKINTESSKETLYYFSQKYQHLKELRQNPQCQVLYSTYPEWLLKFNFFGWVERSNIWSLGKCSSYLP